MCLKGSKIGQPLSIKKEEISCILAGLCTTAFLKEGLYISGQVLGSCCTRGEKGDLKTLAESIDGMGPKTNDLQAREAIIGDVVITAKQ